MGLLNQHDLNNNNLFTNLQGNILKGHGRDFTTNIFIKFYDVKKEEVKKWISTFAEEKITSCKKQLKENELYKRNRVSSSVFYGFFLSAKGYEYLEKSTAAFEDSFVNTMENAQLNDPIKENWEPGFRGELHAMILIGDDNPEKLATETRTILEQLDQLGEVTTIEYGNVLRNENNDGIEHFGYVDGISQPLFFEDELEKYVQQNLGKNNVNPATIKGLLFDPSADKDLVLVNDPLTDAKDAYGSYFVFRKLEQNVRKFKRDEKELADKLKIKDSERMGAMIVGRFEDGTPVQVSEQEGMIGSGAFNNFDYDNGGGKIGDNSKCPFHAHIRKSNPRANVFPADDHKSHIMARRGIPYGQQTMSEELGEDFHKLPEEGVGLLFMSFQKSITNQFEFIQKSWVNNPTFPNFDNTTPDGIDPIIGQDGNGNISKGIFPTTHEDNSPSSLKEGSFESSVNMKGGEYFFAPSIPFLKTLK
jgi:Dyp-type peroxidase family